MPSSCQPPPLGLAVSVTDPASQRPDGSVNARVARAEPCAIAAESFFLLAPVPASMIAGTANPIVAKKRSRHQRASRFFEDDDQV